MTLLYAPLPPPTPPRTLVALFFFVFAFLTWFLAIYYLVLTLIVIVSVNGMAPWPYFVVWTIVALTATVAGLWFDEGPI